MPRVPAAAMMFEPAATLAAGVEDIGRVLGQVVDAWVAISTCAPAAALQLATP
jgi:hypothetical protein